MRGLIPAYIMDRIEEKTGLPMSSLIDVFCGPSTGAIINTALNIPDPHALDKPRYKAKHIARFYEQEGLKIFPQDKFRSFRGFIHDFNNRTMKLSQLNWLLRHGHYEPHYLHGALKRLYGSAKLSDTLKSHIIPTYNIDGEQISLAEEYDDTADTPVRTKNNFADEGGHALWFKNIKFPGAKRRRPSYDVNLIDCVMGSTAAPTYFPCHHFTAKNSQGHLETFSAIDGSIFDNPCISYLGAIRPHIPDNMDVVFIALGTGYTHKSISKEDWNRLGSLGVVDPVNDLPLINIFYHASESALLESFEIDAGQNLHVFNKALTDDISDPNMPSSEINDSSPENLQKMRRFADRIMEENAESFDSLCDLLVRQYEIRSLRRSASSLKNKFFHFFGVKKNKG